jgi:hypothetical protein
VWSWVRVRSPWLILAAGWLVFVIYAHPGLMTRDSYDQLMEVRAREYSDAHPPMMQAIWTVLDLVIAGPFTMIVLQTATFLTGAYLILRRVLSERGSALAAVALLWFPPVGAVMAVVWKDCQMAGFAMLGIALLFADRRWVRVAGCVLLSVACALRYNAFGATLVPILLVFVWSDRLTGLRRYGLASAVWLATTVFAFGANAMLTDKPTHLWHSSLGVSDIVGTLHFTAHDIDDGKLRRALKGTQLIIGHDIHAYARSHYKPDECVWIVLGPDRMFDMSLVESAPPAQRTAVERAWKTIVKGHPIAYLRHRLAVLGAVLGMTGDSWNNKLIVTHDYQNPHELTELGIPTGYTSFQETVGEIYEWCSETWLFRPFIYAAIALVLVVVARRQRDVLAIVCSGIVLESSLFFLGPSADYRYSHWLVVTTILALIIVVTRGFQARRPV